jgi:agmatinase
MYQNEHSTPNEISYAFSGIPTFLGSDYVHLDNLSERKPAIAVMGVPFDEGVPYMPGSRFGPRAIREHSMRFSKNGIYNHQTDQILLRDELAKNRMLDIGDVNITPTDIEGTFRKISDTVRKVMEEKTMLITLGGDHSITYPIVRAIETPHHVVHFDAHTDFFPIRPGFENTNAHAFRHISNMSHVKSLTQVGYRSIRDHSGIDSREAGNRVIGMDEFHTIGPQGVADSIPRGEPCYVSIDIDVLDSSIVPGCVSAEPDGFRYKELRDSLSALASNNRILGFELVEVNPQLDVGTGITSYIAAQTIIEFLGHICVQAWWDE